MGFPSFSVGDVLTAADMNAVGLWKVGGASGTTASNIAVNGCFSSDFDVYQVVITVTSSANTSLYVKLRNGTTDKSANYWYGGFYIPMSGAASINAENSNVALTDGFRVAAMNNSGITVVSAVLGYPFQTSRTTWTGSPQSTEAFARLYNCYHNENYSADGINVIPQTGTITGTVRVYGYRN